MPQTYNLYGDKFMPTDGRSGANISAVRADDLDKKCIAFIERYVQAHGSCNAIDIGGGNGSHSLRMAQAGAKVWMIDRATSHATIGRLNQQNRGIEIGFLQADVVGLRDDYLVPMEYRPLHCIYMQRFINFLSFDETVRLLRNLQSISTPETRFFLSAGGLNSELGEGYPAKDMPIDRRFALLSEAIASKHQIHAKQCLYDESDMRELARLAGLPRPQIWSSPFGNIKLISPRL